MVGPLNRMFYLFRILFLNILFISSGCFADNNLGLVTINNSKVSPSGNFLLELKIEDANDSKYYYFMITDIDKKNIFKCSEKYYLRFAYYLCWDEFNDVVWCYSGDLGAFFWYLDKNGNWIKNVYFSDNSNKNTPPNVLKSLRPNFFNNH
jgi:hypothetical protein